VSTDPVRRKIAAMAVETATTGRRAISRDMEGVGPRLRARREEFDVSLRELARRLDISPSALSQIETGKSRPSVGTLYAIVTELRMSMDVLFGGRLDGAEAPAAAPAPSDPVQRADTRTAVQLESGVRWERLTAHPEADVDFLQVVYDVGGASSSSGELMRHSGREYGLVLTGSLDVTVGFETYHLGPGDSISFDSTTPHRLTNAGDTPATGVWFVTGNRRGETFNGDAAEPA
jgi:transcriptional regulator with XRE-family HTH domain